MRLSDGKEGLPAGGLLLDGGAAPAGAEAEDGDPKRGGEVTDRFETATLFVGVRSAQTDVHRGAGQRVPLEQTLHLLRLSADFMRATGSEGGRTDVGPPFMRAEVDA